VNSAPPSTTNIDDNPTTSVPARRTAGFRPKTIRDVRRDQQTETDKDSAVGGVPVVEVPPSRARALPLGPEREATAPAPSRKTTPITPPREQVAAKPPTEQQVTSPLPEAAEVSDSPRVESRASIFVVAGIVALILAFAGVYFLGKSAGRESNLPVTPDIPTIQGDFPPAAQEKLDAALALLRSGKSFDAWTEIKSLVQRYPTAPSLRYAAAMAAMQADYLNDAERFINDSIAANDRVSDSLALKAAIIGIRSGKPTPEQEDLLRQAIAADPMNANSFLELAALLRYQGRLEEAAGILKSAQARLLPVDSHIVVNTTLALLSLQKEENVPPPASPDITGIPEQDIPMAYALMRQGNFVAAAAILKNSQTLISPDLFAYLIDDPALRKFRKEPPLAGFYR